MNGMDICRQNIKFVQIIEKYPCLYDYTSPDYSRRDANGNAWNLVAKEAKLPVTECKERWKNLRTAFARSQKKLPLDSHSTKKKYYLQEVMSFVLPFIKSRPRRADLPSPNSERNYEVFKEDPTIHEQSESEELVSQCSVTDPSETNQKEGQYEDLQTENFYERPKQFFQSYQDETRITPSTSNFSEQCFVDFAQTATNQARTNADLDFFRSLLPDVDQMDSKRKRRFKRSVLELIDNILAEQEDEEAKRATRRTSSPVSIAASSKWNSPQPLHHI